MAREPAVPKKSVPLSLPEPLVAELDEAARRAGVSRNVWVREAVEARLAGRLDPAAKPVAKAKPAGTPRSRCLSCGASLAHPRPLHQPGCKAVKRA